MSNSHGPDFSTCFRFPLASPEARQDILIGGTLMLTLGIGWIFNLGHRLDVVHRLAQRQQPIFRGFAPWSRTFGRGLQAFAAIMLYLSLPLITALVAYVAWKNQHPVWSFATLSALALGILAVYVLPGGMTHNAAYRDMSLLYRPDKALRVALSGGRAYLKA